MLADRSFRNIGNRGFVLHFCPLKICFVFLCSTSGVKRERTDGYESGVND
jgi:hypothetical protein